MAVVVLPASDISHETTILINIFLPVEVVVVVVVVVEVLVVVEVVVVVEVIVVEVVVVEVAVVEVVVAPICPKQHLPASPSDNITIPPSGIITPSCTQQ